MSLRRFIRRRFTLLRLELKDSTISHSFNLDKINYSFEMTNFFRQNSKIDFNTFNKTGGKGQKRCKQKIVVHHFELESFHLRLHPGFDVVDLTKISGLSRPHEFTKLVVSKKSTLESGLKNIRFRCADSLTSCGRAADWYKKKRMRFQIYSETCGQGLKVL